MTEETGGTESKRHIERGLGRAASVSALAEEKDSVLVREDESPLAPLKRKIRAVYITKPIVMEFIAELIGTFVFILFGICCVSAAAIMGAQQGLWQVAVIWGFGLALAIYAVGPISGGHLNPAVTLSFALLRPKSFPMRKLGFYWLAQFTGAFFAGIANLVIYRPVIDNYEIENGIVRGEMGSERSAMVFGEYFVNPALYPGNYTLYQPLGAFFVEVFGTAVFMFLIMALTSPALPDSFRKNGTPFFIGMSVASLISLYAPITQGCFNPARDFGPRIVAAIGGWGSIAFPGPQSGFWVYLFGPIIGAPIGAAIYDLFLETAY